MPDRADDTTPQPRRADKRSTGLCRARATAVARGPPAVEGTDVRREMLQSVAQRRSLLPLAVPR